jgi:hypothetical protein
VRAGQLCIGEGRWDGGDDSDPTYVPDSGYTFTLGCVEATPEEAAAALP